MKTTDHAVRCVLCGAAHEQSSNLTGRSKPQNGDVTLCIRCGGWLVFDDSLIDGVRPPTPAERMNIRNDERAMRVLLAWQMTKAIPDG